jgi:acyl-ACP thioesterase
LPAAPVSPFFQVTLNCDNANPEGAESENTKTEGLDVTDAEMLDRYVSDVSFLHHINNTSYSSGIHRWLIQWLISIPVEEEKE